mgnify:CR=1 FL=1
MIKFILMFVFVACSYSPKSPEGLIKMYVSDTSTKKVDREYYEKYTTGEILDATNEMTDDELETSSKMGNVKKAQTKIVMKKCENDDKCVVTYIVEYTYQSAAEKKATFKNEVKKIAEVEKVDGSWKIASVTNLKTYIEANEPIDAMKDPAN